MSNLWRVFKSNSGNVEQDDDFKVATVDVCDERIMVKAGHNQMGVHQEKGGEDDLVHNNG